MTPTGHDGPVKIPENTSPTDTPAVAHPSATIVLLRDRAGSIEALLVRRNKKLDFHGGAWVFPGGRIDAADLDRDGIIEGDAEMRAARRAAVRELQEEAGLTVPADDLMHVSTWTTPDVLPKRFRTLFFVAPGDGAVRVDGGEIHDHRWATPADALAAAASGELELPPPQYVTLRMLEPYASVADALDAMRDREPPSFSPRFVSTPRGAVCLYDDDAGYETRSLDVPGARHRLWMTAPEWRYERS